MSITGKKKKKKNQSAFTNTMKKQEKDIYI
jgi:hypothetical protein